MSLDKLRELVAAAAKATPGEWRSEKEDTDSGLHADWLVQAICGHSWDNIASCGSSAYEDDWQYTEELRQANAAFIAKAKTAMPDLESLLSRHEALKAAMREARAEIISLACTGTERIRDLGGECDDAEKTYGPAIARIDKALAELEALAEKQP